jgi:UPF0755 protein
MAVRQSFYGPGPLAATGAVVVPSGGTASVADALVSDGVVGNAMVFRAAAWATRGEGRIHAGEFLIRAHASLAEVLDVLRHGAPVEHHVTIPEGLTGAEIAAILNQVPGASGMVAAPAEGVVLPETYEFTLGTSRAAILARAEAAMRRGLAQAWAGRDARVKLASPGQALILASIVQAESPLPGELPEIAAVYENRLAKGMKLQADPAVIFAASRGQRTGGSPISRADLANPSPYNSYAHAGLPPGPICAPGIAAIDAVLHPAASKAIYFVATGTGGHAFAENFAEQLKNIAAYRQRTTK